MSTRAQIGIYEKETKPLKKFDVLLYKHSDGYPEGVLPLIVPFLKRFDKGRGISDTEYCGAWLVHHMIEDYLRYKKEWAAEWKEKTGKDTPFDKDFLGHGICKGFHGDIEYFYKVYPGFVEVYEVGYDDNFNIDLNKFRLIQKIDLSKEWKEEPEEVLVK